MARWVVLLPMVDEQVVALAHRAIENRIFPDVYWVCLDNGRQDVRAFSKPTYDTERGVRLRSTHL